MSRQLPAGIEAAPEIEFRAEVIRCLESVLNIVNGSGDLGADPEETTRFLEAQNNLSDLTSVEEARDNLGITDAVIPGESHLRCYLPSNIGHGGGSTTTFPVAMTALLDTDNAWSGSAWTAPYSGVVLFALRVEASFVHLNGGSIGARWISSPFQNDRYMDTNLQGNTAVPASTRSESGPYGGTFIHSVSAGDQFSLELSSSAVTSASFLGGIQKTSLSVAYISRA